MNGEYMSLETAKKKRRYIILIKRIKILKKENKRLNNIIREVRELIKRDLSTDETNNLIYSELLDIIGEENNNE